MKQFKFLAILLMAGLSFASCIDVETPKLTPPPVTAPGEGAFVLNQGNQAVIPSMIGKKIYCTTVCLALSMVVLWVKHRKMEWCMVQNSM